MSMKPHGLEPIPEETARLAQRLCPNGTMVMQLRDLLGPIYSDEQFAHLFPKRGRPAQAPWRLALVTVLQAIEGLSDRQAAQYVRTRIDWLYALGLPLDDPGFDFSILTDFRQRLLDAQAEDLTSDVFLQMVEGIHHLRAEDEAGFTAWLLRITRVTVAGYYRKREKQPAHLSLPGEAWENTHAESLILLESRHLSRGKREVIQREISHRS